MGLYTGALVPGGQYVLNVLGVGVQVRAAFLQGGKKSAQAFQKNGLTVHTTQGGRRAALADFLAGSEKPASLPEAFSAPEL